MLSLFNDESSNGPKGGEKAKQASLEPSPRFNSLRVCTLGGQLETQGRTKSIPWPTQADRLDTLSLPWSALREQRFLNTLSLCPWEVLCSDKTLRSTQMGPLESPSKPPEVALEQVAPEGQSYLGHHEMGRRPPDAVRAPAPVINVLSSEIGFKARFPGGPKALSAPGRLGFMVFLLQPWLRASMNLPAP